MHSESLQIQRQAYKNSAPLCLMYPALRSGLILKFNLKCAMRACRTLRKFKALRKILNFTAAQITRRFGLGVYLKPAKLGGKISTSPP
ncbi:hypothetical protein [uncultured Campylobacter sp.]|uniref:hypothetical protein n=1 Tax=uncultured Campylobacter sp. TaxID=218934 RepID=UPI002607181C|nr:hypothetical protein [uncultured Campylobacter sp.]